MRRTGATFDDAAAEYLRYLEHDRQRKPSTLRDARATIRNHLVPTFAGWPLEEITADAVERWARGLRDKPLATGRARRSSSSFTGSWSGPAGSGSCRRTRSRTSIAPSPHRPPAAS